MKRCPALLVSAMASGQGKTTFTAALARLHSRLGRRVRVFKTGPDFLDPTILARASGAGVYNLDLWMGGDEHCRHLLYQAAGEADLILVEGVMGLFDGTPSSADLATLFGIPVLAVIDAAAMAQTFAAVAHGLASLRPALPFAGVAANRVGSPAHTEMLRESLPDSLRFLGALPHADDSALPERHLGLHAAGEIADLDSRLDALADRLEEAIGSALPPAVDFAAAAPATAPPASLAGKTVAVAQDAAFAFLYPANLDTLRALGAELFFFSPLSDSALPEADALWLPGGYPELYLRELQDNVAMQTALRAHHGAGKPILAECGGLLYLLDALTDAEGRRGALVGLLPGEAFMQTRLANLGMHSLELPQGELRGHSFHYARLAMGQEPHAHTRAARHQGQAEGVWRQGGLTASFFHAYFPSNPLAVAGLFGA